MECESDLQTAFLGIMVIEINEIVCFNGKKLIVNHQLLRALLMSASFRLIAFIM